MIEPLVKPRVVADLFQSSTSLIYRLAAQGLLPCVRLKLPSNGKQVLDGEREPKHLVRFRLSEIEKFIDDHTVRPLDSKSQSNPVRPRPKRIRQTGGVMK